MGSGIGNKRGTAVAFIGLVAALGIVASACGGSSGGGSSGGVVIPTTVAGAGTTGEATPGDATTTTTPIGDEPEWASQELVLNTIAETGSPIALVGRSGTQDLYVANKTGTVDLLTRTVTRNQPDRFRVSDTPVLDISDQVSSGNEQGLLDIAFSSDGRNLYASYTDRSGTSLVDRYTMGSRGADLDSRVEVLRVEQPASNHNGGGITFGPDGFLYVGLGDGGRAGDPLGSGQDTETVLGSILRIDPDGAADGQGYAVPNGNPFVDGGGAPEVWLFGVRNPWRFSFDEESGNLWVADVGQDKFEEVTLIRNGGRGANLGWNQMEGFQPYDGGTEPADHVPPLLAYPHENGRCSVTGGYAYRGEFLHRFEGVYIFGDYCSGEVFGVAESAGGPIFRTLNLNVGSGTLGSFGVDADGEIYLLSLEGPISRFEPTEADVVADAAAAEAEAEARSEAEAEAEAEAESIVDE